MRDPPPADGRRLLCVDLWHTLVYLEPGPEERYMREQVDLACAVLSEARALPGRAPSPRSALRPTFEAVYAEAVVASQQGRSVTPAAQIAEAGRRTGRIPDKGEYVDQLAELLRGTDFRRAPHAVEVLRGLREDGWRTALVSNTVGEPGASIRPVLERMGLTELLDVLVFSDELPWTKPAPEIFLRATERSRVAPERTVHVGDGWVDIEGARRAGLRAGVLYTGLQHYGRRYRELFLPQGWADPATPYRVQSWPELPELLASLG
jgi:HAD superfamily hydrolase (TIGR01509 family)